MTLKNLIFKLVTPGIMVFILLYRENSLKLNAVSVPLIGLYCVVSLGFIWYYLKNKNHGEV